MYKIIIIIIIIIIIVIIIRIIIIIKIIKNRVALDAILVIFAWGL